MAGEAAKVTKGTSDASWGDVSTNKSVELSSLWLEVADAREAASSSCSCLAICTRSCGKQPGVEWCEESLALGDVGRSSNGVGIVRGEMGVSGVLGISSWVDPITRPLLVV